MRKSERIRLLEMELLRTQFQIEVINASISALLESNKVKAPDLDAGKWYSSKLNKDK
jgi:hypothetical protein